MEHIEGDYNKLSKKITIGDVANALGVSKTTVSRAISGKGRIGLETREKVLDYISKNNYKPNIIAKGLAQSKTYNIGIALPGDYNLIDLPFFQSCLLGICEVASRFNYDVLVTVVSENDISELERVVMNNKVDGFILTRTMVKDDMAEYLKANQIPFITIGSLEDDDVIQVDNNHYEACKELTSILLMKGLKQIALIGGNTNHVVTQNRYLGYVHAHEELGRSVKNELVYFNASNNIVTEKIVEELIDEHVDCIICMDDSICMNALNKLSKIHIRVPEDVKLASYYNSALLDHNVPTITSLKFNPKEVGMMACQTLLDVLDGKTVKKKMLLGYEVVLKESTKFNM